MNVGDNYAASPGQLRRPLRSRLEAHLSSSSEKWRAISAGGGRIINEIWRGCGRQDKALRDTTAAADGLTALEQ